MTVEPLPDLPDFCWPVDTSCYPAWDAWEILPSDDTAGVPRYSAAAKARAISLAGQTLRMLTLFQVGGCPVTVRPACRSCSEQTWRAYPVSGAPWTPMSVGGQWINISCGHSSSCGCLGAREVRLAYTVGGIVAVTIDGMTLDPSAYRLDAGGRLVRTDGSAWPLWQDLTKPDTEEGTWSVTYLPGAPVDGLGAYVAGLLAVEYLKACSGDNCQLPASVSQITRQGVTMTLTPGAFPDGKTGIREVDAWLERWNPNGHTSPPAVFSPDVHRPRASRANVTLPSPGGIDDGGGADASGTPEDGGGA